MFTKILNILYPKFCFNCGKEGTYLCQDCQSTMAILDTHKICKTANLKDLYWALPYQGNLIKNLIRKFKYEPFIKELAIPLTSLIINHFQLIEKSFADFSNFILIPVPLEKRKIKWRGFNQAEEIGKELAKLLKIPLVSDCLIKTKETLPQVKFKKEKRKENLKEAFSIKNKKQVSGRKILLIDDVYTTGSTMEESAHVLKDAGATEIIGVVVARG